MKIEYPIIEVTNGDEKFAMLLQAGGLAADVTPEGQGVIYVLAGYQRHFPMHVYDFALHHEAAHLDLGHLENLDPTILYDLPQFELEADERAVKHYGCSKSAMADMLNTLASSLTAVLAEHGIALAQNILEEAVVGMREHHAYRLRALEA